MEGGRGNQSQTKIRGMDAEEKGSTLSLQVLPHQLRNCNLFTEAVSLPKHSTVPNKFRGVSILKTWLFQRSGVSSKLVFQLREGRVPELEMFFISFQKHTQMNGHDEKPSLESVMNCGQRRIKKCVDFGCGNLREALPFYGYFSQCGCIYFTVITAIRNKKKIFSENKLTYFSISSFIQSLKMKRFFSFILRFLRGG